ncbi:SDR family NAD(P)-dependent oxidoreductase [Solwaraspora sp. WMMD406]|uniref:SDR family NAD(P)-dependent oxidoreductase n=1 Tax=Solwaraspora sp. WMMD406 TaxID=3016095 RepID=UPI002415ACFC|nr:SDR family NAD(P)-dependent oxidoreductase [Solwaraspora sp. WMMD406]MDG4763010.1 SDR family NAD(P)-dependent oxidoreductase [Solwaraspora sp. WMMD406]
MGGDTGANSETIHWRCTGTSLDCPNISMRRCTTSDQASAARRHRRCADALGGFGVDVSGVVALVTGGASGLGMATARRLLSAGAKVVLVDLPTTDGRSRTEKLGEHARFVAANVKDEDQLGVAFDVAGELGELRLVANCAIIGTPGRTIGRDGPMSLGRFRKIIEVNVVGTFNVARLAADRMRHLGPVNGERGVIVNQAAVAQTVGEFGRVAYSTSMGGVAAMTLPLAQDLAELQIRVVTIVPGVFDLPLFDSLPHEVRESLDAQVPHPSRLGEPDEFADLVMHIAANQMLNGTTIRLDGAIRPSPR